MGLLDNVPSVRLYGGGSSGGGGGLKPLRIESGRFRTDDAWIVPRAYSVFHAPALVRDGNIGELRRLLQRAADARCNFVRVFGSWFYIFGGIAPYSMADHGWFDWMQVVFSEAASFGLWVELSYFCDAQVLVPSRADRIRFFEGLAHWTQDKPVVVVTAANEARKNGWSEADDPDLLDLVRRFRSINPTTLIGASDPLDAGQESQSADAYNAAQKNIAGAGVHFLLVHPNRKDRYEWVDHLKGSAETPGAVGFAGKCWIQEPMGGASRDIPGKRDSSVTAHVAAACCGAMSGAYTYMHRQMEDDVCPGLLESAAAADIPGSPDYHYYNSGTPGTHVPSFRDFGKCRTINNGSQGWAVAYGPHEGSLEYAPGWHETARTRWNDGAGTCILTQASRQ